MKNGEMFIKYSSLYKKNISVSCAKKFQKIFIVYNYCFEMHVHVNLLYATYETDRGRETRVTFCLIFMKFRMKVLRKFQEIS